MLQEYITKMNSNGTLELDQNVIKDLIGKKLKNSIFPDNEIDDETDIDNFNDLLRNGPKVYFKNDDLTREWIHQGVLQKQIIGGLFE